MFSLCGFSSTVIPGTCNERLSALFIPAQPKKPLQHLPVRAVAIVGDFLAVATSSPDIQLVDLDGMKRRRTLQGHLLAVSALASLDGGKRLVSGSHDTFIRLVGCRTESLNNNIRASAVIVWKFLWFLYPALNCNIMMG